MMKADHKYSLARRSVKLRPRPRDTRSRDFSCRASSGLLEPVSSTLISYDITHSTHAKCLCPQRFIPRTSRLLILDARQAARPDLLDLLAGIHDLDDRSVLENFCQSWTARLGLYNSDLQSLRLVQDRRAAMVVDSVDAHSFC